MTQLANEDEERKYDCKLRTTEDAEHRGDQQVSEEQ